MIIMFAPFFVLSIPIPVRRSKPLFFFTHVLGGHCYLSNLNGVKLLCLSSILWLARLATSSLILAYVINSDYLNSMCYMIFPVSSLFNAVIL